MVNGSLLQHVGAPRCKVENRDSFDFLADFLISFEELLLRKMKGNLPSS